MKLETILKAAKNSLIKGSHIPGRGHVGESEGEHKAEHLRQLERSVQNEIENMNFAPGYAESGYEDPKRGVLFANWNVFPRNLDRILEKAGYAVEWSDEWTTCCDCGKALRTSPNSYSWTSSYRILNEGELVCLNCLDPADYLESIEDDPNHACPPEKKFNPLDHGYIKYNGDFETGFHPGQSDDPKKILNILKAQGKTGVVFRIAAKGQFDITWEAFYKNQT